VDIKKILKSILILFVVVMCASFVFADQILDFSGKDNSNFIFVDTCTDSDGTLLTNHMANVTGGAGGKWVGTADGTIQSNTCKGTSSGENGLMAIGYASLTSLNAFYFRWHGVSASRVVTYKSTGTAYNTYALKYENYGTPETNAYNGGSGTAICGSTNFDTLGWVDVIMELDSNSTQMLYNLTIYSEADHSIICSVLNFGFYTSSNFGGFGIAQDNGYFDDIYGINGTAQQLIALGTPPSLPIITNQLNWTNDRITYTMSAQSSVTGQCSLWGNWTGSWSMNETKSMTATTQFNFTSITFKGKKTSLWGINCSDNLGNEAWGLNLSFDIANTAPTIPIVTAPVVDDHGNQNWTFSYSSSDVDGDELSYEVYAGENSSDYALKQSSTSTSWTSNFIIDGNFTVRVRAYDGTVYSDYAYISVVMDTINPDFNYINLIWSNVSVMNNDTAIVSTASIFNITSSADDLNNLDSMQLYIRDGPTTLINQTWSDINQNFYLINQEISLAGVSNGATLIGEILVSDVHTKQELSEAELDYTINDDKVTFDSEGINNIYLEVEKSDKNSTFKNFIIDKKIDRYEFGAEFAGGVGQYTTVFRLSSDKPIKYLPNSEYQGHFIIYNGNGLNGNWIDFEGMGDVAVAKEGDDYLITVKHNAPKIVSHSIGGLNVNKVNFKVLYNTAPVLDQALTDQEVDSGSTFYYDVNCSDADSQAITYSDNTTLFAIDPDTGIINYLVPESQAGVYNILITCDDGTETVTDSFVYIVNDIFAPVWSNAVKNKTSVYHNDNVLFSVDWTDSKELAGFIFSTNDTGAWVNSSLQSIVGTSDTASYAYTITAPRNTNVGWRMWAKDTSDNWNATDTFGFAVTNYVPTHSTPILNSSQGTNYNSEDLTCYAKDVADADGDDVNIIYNWYKNSDPLMDLLLPFDFNADDYSGRNNDGVVTGATYTVGKYGKALDFDGIDDYVNVSDDPSLDFVNAKTWELWFKRDGTGAETLLDKTNASNVSNYRLQFTADNKLQLLYAISGVVGGDYVKDWSTQSDFNAGTYSNTQYSVNKVQLTPAQTSGTYISEAFDSQAADTNWKILSWNKGLPYGIGLPDNKGSDVGADMAGDVLLLHMDEASGTIADSSGAGNNGAYNGALYSQGGKVNTGIGFDGVNDNINTGDINALDGLSELTVSFWMKSDTLNDYATLAAKWVPATGYQGWLIEEGTAAIQGNNDILFAVSDDGNDYGVTQTDVLSAGVWKYVVGVFNGSAASNADRLKIYIDGQQKTLAFAGTITTTTRITSESVMIGTRSNNAYPFDGTMDEVAIWNRSLNANEILNLYKRGALRLNLTVRSCSLDNCTGESWAQTYTASPQSLNVSNNRYFQYKADFVTDNSAYSPELYNVNISDTKSDVISAHSSISSTSVIADTNWHHAVVSYGNSMFNLYLDNVLETSKSENNLSAYDSANLLIGRDISGNYFDGAIDEIRLYNYALSSGQIAKHYALQYNVISSQETALYDQFSCRVTSNDGEADGATLSSSTLTIQNAVPASVSLLYPVNNTHFGAPVEFNWTASSDADNDALYYYIQIDNDSGFTSPEYSALVSDTKALPASLPIINGNYYYWRVLVSDGYDNSSWTDVRRFKYVWEIWFNVQSSELNVNELNGTTINCSYVDFDQFGDTTNPYGPYEFPQGEWGCTFVTANYYGKTRNFIVERNTQIDVSMDIMGSLTDAEHTWLGAIFDCLYSGNCLALDLLLEINQTTNTIWNNFKRTDQSVVTFENLTSLQVTNTSNITIQYTVNIPVKQGYSLGNYLPLRIGYWFLNENNDTCYNQGTKPTGIEVPYCQPLIIQTMGPMGGNVNFRVDLRPQLPIGNYTLVRNVEIDPNNIWINYGQEIIGSIEVLTGITNAIANVKNSNELNTISTTPIIYQIINQYGNGGSSSSGYLPLDREEVSTTSSDNTNKNSQLIQQKGINNLPIEDSLFTNEITGAIIGAPKTNPFVGFLVTMTIVVLGLSGYFRRRRF
jgi:hypothetical protein